MGSWFSNLHIRKNGTITKKTILEYINKIMGIQQYLPAESEEDADGAFAIITEDKSQWYSVYSDLFSFEDPKQFAEYATPMSEEMKTDILGISCFDSDYLYLDLIDAKNKVDAWCGVGSAAGLGIGKRTNLSAWKNKISDFDRFKESVKKKYVFAEEVLSEIEDCIHLPQEHGTAVFEYLDDLGLNKAATYVYFKLPESKKIQEAPKLVEYVGSLMPCFLDKPSVISVINVGGASKGLSLYFLGSYVEHDEITFSEVSFVEWKGNSRKNIPIELKKVQLSDGEWAYYYHDPGYRLSPKVDDRFSGMKRVRMESEQSITIRFVPHGESRKILDISVFLVPDKNPEGQVGWNVWHQFGSKKAYIQYHNKSWGKKPGYEHLLLRDEDFD